MHLPGSKVSFYGFPPPHIVLFDTQSATIFYLPSNGLKKRPPEKEVQTGFWELTVGLFSRGNLERHKVGALQEMWEHAVFWISGSLSHPRFAVTQEEQQRPYFTQTW